MCSEARSLRKEIVTGGTSITPLSCRIVCAHMPPKLLCGVQRKRADMAYMLLVLEMSSQMRMQILLACVLRFRQCHSVPSEAG